MKGNKCCNQTMCDVGLLALRVAIGVIFIYHGWGKLGDVSGFAGMLSQWGFPLAGILAWVVALVEFVGGIAVLLGVYLRSAAKCLAIVMIIALLFVHTKMPWSAAELPIALLGGTLALAGVGGGRWKLLKKECVCGTGGCCKDACGPKDSADCGPEEKKSGGCC